MGSPIYFADPKHTFDSAPFAADLNNDGRSDIVAVASPPAGGVTSNGTLAVFVGNSNRTLSYKTLTNSACAGPDGTGITVADFDGDGLNDLAYTAVPCNSNSVQTSLIVRLGTGSGNFGAEQNIYQNPFQLAQPYAVLSTTGNRPDIVFDQFNGTTTDSFELLLNDGIGRFPNCGISVAEGISICQPQPKSASPVIFSLATAGPTPMRTAAVWVDGKKVDEQLAHAFSNYSFLDASIPMTLGTHKVTIFGTGWDNTLQQKTFSVDVNSNNGCGAPTSPGVFLCQPAEDTTVSSPVQVVATATVTGKFARMEVWIDGVKKYTQTTNPVLLTTIPVSAGTHRFGVFAVNTAGTKWEAVANATVK